MMVQHTRYLLTFIQPAGGNVLPGATEGYTAERYVESY